jgi:hypothetical protein
MLDIEAARTALSNYREQDGIDQRDTDALADFVEAFLTAHDRNAKESHR